MSKTYSQDRIQKARLERWGTLTTLERFWLKVNKTDTCWLWTGSLTSDGYGSFQGGYAHRIAYELSGRDIPMGLQLDHLCRVRRCLRPTHLEPVTNRENSRRGKAEITRCPQGHEYDAVNTYLTRQGHRTCRKCHAAHERMRLLRIKE